MKNNELYNVANDYHQKKLEILKKEEYVFYNHEENKIFFDEDKTYYISNWGKIYSSIKNMGEHNSHITTALTTIGVDMPELANIEKTTEVEPLPEKTVEEITSKTPEEFKKETLPVSTFENHQKYLIDFSKKVGYGAGMFLTNHFLASMGLPPTVLLKPLIIGGVKVVGSVTGVAINYGIANPATTTALVANIPIAYTYAEKAVKKLTETKKEDQPVNIDQTLDPTVVPTPPVNQPIIESHSIYDFFEIIGSITWKVLKKIHDYLI